MVCQYGKLRLDFCIGLEMFLLVENCCDFMMNRASFDGKDESEITTILLDFSKLFIHLCDFLSCGGSIANNARKEM